MALQVVGVISDTHGLPRPQAVAALAGRRILLLHNLAELGINPRVAGIDVVIVGHSHRPKIETRDEVLYVNPGSAGPRRFKLPIAVARIEVTARSVEARIVQLSV